MSIVFVPTVRGEIIAKNYPSEFRKIVYSQRSRWPQYQPGHRKSWRASRSEKVLHRCLCRSNRWPCAYWPWRQLALRFGELRLWRLGYEDVGWDFGDVWLRRERSPSAKDRRRRRPCQLRLHAQQVTQTPDAPMLHLKRWQHRGCFFVIIDEWVLFTPLTKTK